jgi:hypothetical protein
MNHLRCNMLLVMVVVLRGLLELLLLRLLVVLLGNLLYMRLTREARVGMLL